MRALREISFVHGPPDRFGDDRLEGRERRSSDIDDLGVMGESSIVTLGLTRRERRYAGVGRVYAQATASLTPQVVARAAASRQLYNPLPGTSPSSTFDLFTLEGTSPR